MRRDQPPGLVHRANGPRRQSLYPHLDGAGTGIAIASFAKAEPVRTRYDAAFRCIHHRVQRPPQRIPSLLSKAQRSAGEVHGHAATGAKRASTPTTGPRWRKNQDEYRRKLYRGEPSRSRPNAPGSMALDHRGGSRRTGRLVIHGNVANDGLHREPSSGHGCVEVACLINDNRVQAEPIRATSPPHGRHLRLQYADVRHGRRGDCIESESKEMAAQALMLDPLTAAVCSSGGDQGDDEQALRC